jgi:cation diffusion facilitator CzcD-associated flavoprotein CzcO
MGPLSKPKFPGVPGIDRFAGESFHSARWRHDVHLRGKNVVVIGTGASAIQFVPQIAPQVGKLTILQRTPPWIIPRGDAEVGPLRRALRRWVPGYAWLVRKLVYWSQEVRAIGFVVNPKLLEAREKLIRRYIERSVTDPDLRRKVTPEYRAGCKRILISDDYYPAIQRENVELVTTPLAEIREHSVVDANGREYPADVVIYGTGFKATEGIVPARVYGRGGAELSEKWRDGMSAYLGTTVAGYPNLFFLIGPNTGLGHNSMIFMMEAQYRYILSALDEVKRRGATSVEVKPEVQAHFNERLQAKMKGTVWATGCSSWYQDANGKNVSLWPGFTFAYRRLTARLKPERFRFG